MPQPFGHRPKTDVRGGGRQGDHRNRRQRLARHDPRQIQRHRTAKADHRIRPAVCRKGQHPRAPVPGQHRIGVAQGDSMQWQKVGQPVKRLVRLARRIGQHERPLHAQRAQFLGQRIFQHPVGKVDAGDRKSVV